MDAPFFNRINIPIGLALDFPDRHGSADRLAQEFARKLEARVLDPDHCRGGAHGCCWRIFGAYEHPYALVSFGLCMFVTATIVIRILERRFGHSRQGRRGVHPGRHRADAPQYAALWRIPGPHGHRVHVHRLHGRGVQSGRHQGSGARAGASIVGHYNLRIANIQGGENDTYAWQRLAVEVSRNGSSLWARCTRSGACTKPASSRRRRCPFADA